MIFCFIILFKKKYMSYDFDWNGYDPYDSDNDYVNFHYDPYDSDSDCSQLNHYNEIEDNILAMCQTPNCCLEDLDRALDEGGSWIFPHDDYTPILTACEYKNYKVIEWFMSTYQYANHIIYQKIASIKLQFEVAQWFRETYHIQSQSLAIPIHLFKNHLHEVQQNHEICEFVDNNMAIIIRTKKQVIWYRRKYPVWLSSRISPNKECIFYCIPKEISRYIIQCFL